MPKTVQPAVFLIAKTAPDHPEMRSWLDFIGANEFEIPSGRLCPDCEDGDFSCECGGIACGGPENCVDCDGLGFFTCPRCGGTNEIEAASIGNLLITLAGKRCYMSYQPGLNPNVSKVRTDLAAFIDNILKVGHGSVIEHVNYTFAIENVSRVFTAEFNRHRAGLAVSEGSMRYIRFDDLAYWIPESIQPQSWEDYKVTNRTLKTASQYQTHNYSYEACEDLSYKEPSKLHPVDKMMVANFHNWLEQEEAKTKTRAVFNRSFLRQEAEQKELAEIWNYPSLTAFFEKKKLTSLFRRLIGMGVATGGVWTGNLRALRHIFTMRCDPSAEEEICYVASMMLERMIEAEPDVFGDFEKVDGYWRPKYKKV